MKRTSTWLALPLLIAAQSALTQPIDLGPKVSSYTRFLVYPHLQKGFEAMERGDRAQAIAEFSQARRLAPDSPVIAGYLAEAYRRSGDLVSARKLLQAELARHPDDARLKASLAALTPAPSAPAPRPAVRAAPPVATTTPAAGDASTPEPSVPSAASAAPVVLAARPRPPQAAPSIARAQARKPTVALRPAAPAPPAGYPQADAAYKASARGDFPAAAAAAREAVRQAPDNADYRRLLAYALLEIGNYDELQAVAAGTTDAQLLALANQAREREAYLDFEKANRALAQGQVEAAVEHAKRSVERAPSSRVHWMQWAAALLAAERFAETDQAVTRALARLGTDDAELRVLRGHARQRLGDDAGAAADYDRAMVLATSEPLQQNVRLIAADAALAAALPQRALGVLAPFGETDDAAVTYRRRLALSALQRSATPQPVIVPGLAVPRVICVGSSFSAACDLWPGEMPAEPGQDSAQAAYQALARQDPASAVAQAQRALEQAPRNARYQLLLVRALLADAQAAQALEAADRFLAKPPREPEMLALRSQIQRRLNRPREALADADAALADPRLSVVSEIDLLLAHHPDRARARFDAALRSGALNDYPATDLGYLAVRVGDDATALAAFDRAAGKGELPDRALQDAGYAAGRLGRSDAAVGYFSRAIDAAEAGRLSLEPQRLFETRREVADRSRTWGAIASLGYRGVSPGGGAGQPVTIGDSVQAGAELYWRPFGYGDGRYVEVYGGAFQTLWTKGSAPSGGDTTQALVGVRAKPLRDANLVLSFERRIKVGHFANNDWLLRAGYSYSYGTDLRVDRPQWTTAQVYAEAGRFFSQRLTYATLEAQIGRSIRLDALHPRLVLFPHLVLGADYNSRLPRGQRDALGAGVGAGVRYWFNESRYSAPRSYLDLSLQYRARLGGDARGKGVFLRATLVY